MIVLYVLLAILLFGVLILVHEFGHFITAKLFGIRVNEFSLFMGPAIWKKQFGETLYAIRCIPVGGYCAMEGEDGDSDDPRAFGKASVWKRFIVLVAGALMNLVIGFVIALIFTTAFDFNIPGYLPSKTIGNFAENSPYQSEMGLQVSDEIYSVDDQRVYVFNDFQLLLDRNESQVYDIVVVRDGEKVELTDFPLHLLEIDGRMAYGLTFRAEEKTVGAVLSYSYDLCRDFARLVWMSLGDLFSGKAGLSDVGGPVVIVETVVESSVAAEETRAGLGIINILYYFAFIAINLAVMNLLPIPALDGGRAVCLLVTAVVEKILRRKIDPKYEGYLHGVFLLLLLLFMALITFKDIFHLFGG